MYVLESVRHSDKCTIHYYRMNNIHSTNLIVGDVVMFTQPCLHTLGLEQVINENIPIIFIGIFSSTGLLTRHVRPVFTTFSMVRVVVDGIYEYCTTGHVTNFNTYDYEVIRVIS